MSTTPPPPPPAAAPQPPTPANMPPQSYLVWAILTTIFCCLPFGIVSIVYAAQVNGKWAAGDIVGANLAASNAKKWAIVSAVVGIVVAVLYLIFFVVLGGLAASSSST